MFHVRTCNLYYVQLLFSKAAFLSAKICGFLALLQRRPLKDQSRVHQWFNSIHAFLLPLLFYSSPFPLFPPLLPLLLILLRASIPPPPDPPPHSPPIHSECPSVQCMCWHTLHCLHVPGLASTRTIPHKGEWVCGWGRASVGVGVG